MQYISNYESPLGKIVLASDEIGLTGLWFCGQKYFPKDLDNDYIYKIADEKSEKLFFDAKKWLDVYFSNEKPDFTPKLHLIGTDFQKIVWEILLNIPYGKTTTYGEISSLFENKTGKRVYFQAIGGSIGRNKISIIVPCHRVIGKNGELIGYAGGIDRKQKLLEIERGF